MSKHLKAPDVSGLKKILNEFDVYQSSAFVTRKPEFFALEVCGEVGELANLEKKIWRDPARTDVLDKCAEEAADVFIALCNYCNSRQIDLEATVKEKLVEIEKRRLQGKMGAIQNS